MLNGDVDEFVEQIETGLDLYFMYKNQKFFLDGITAKIPIEGTSTKELRNYQCLLRIDPPLDHIVWELIFPAGVGFPAEEFLKARIFDGKTFWEVQEEIEWIDC